MLAGSWVCALASKSIKSHFACLTRCRGAIVAVGISLLFKESCEISHRSRNHHQTRCHYFQLHKKNKKKTNSKLTVRYCCYSSVPPKINPARAWRGLFVTYLPCVVESHRGVGTVSTVAKALRAHTVLLVLSDPAIGVAV